MQNSTIETINDSTETTFKKPKFINTKKTEKKEEKEIDKNETNNIQIITENNKETQSPVKILPRENKNEIKNI